MLYDNRSCETESSVNVKKSVLVVDDDEMSCKVTVRMLKKLGYTVLLARGGREALRVFQENRGRINLIILDFIMPDMTGRQVYHLLREADSKIKVIFTSGYEIKAVPEMISKGACDFLPKPYSLKELELKVSKALSTEIWKEFS